MMLSVEKLSVGYRTPVVRDLTFRVKPGEFIGVIGPNGTGKSTLIKTLYGFLKPLAGSLQLLDRELSDYNPQKLARLIAVMPQDPPDDLGFTAEEVVSFGRHPYLRGWGWFSAEDKATVRRALEFSDAWHLRDRLMEHLSGGERQRVRFARAVAQAPRLLLLDEPTTHMDLNRQLELLELTSRLCREGVAAVMVMHDLNQAAQYCQRLLLLAQGGLFADGSPQRVLTEDNLAAAFNVPVHIRYHPQTGAPYMLPRLSLNRGQRGRLHVIAGGGSGKTLIPQLYRLGFDLSVGVVNALDSDAELAGELGIPVILEAPFSPISEENRLHLEEHLQQAQTVVVAPLEIGDGNIANLEALESILIPKRVFFVEGLNDHTHGRARAIVQSWVDRGATVASESDILRILHAEHPTSPLRPPCEE